MPNTPTVTDKTTLNPSPTLYPDPQLPDPSAPPLYPIFSTIPTVPTDPIPPHLPFSTNPQSSPHSDTDSVKSDPSESSIDSIKKSFDFTISGVHDQHIAELRRQFLKHWHTSVEIEKEYIEASSKSKTRLQAPAINDLKEKRTEIHKTTLNFLNQYAFAVIRDKLESKNTEQTNPDDTAKYTRELREYIINKGGSDHLVTVLLQNLATVNGKKLEFEHHVLLILQKEALGLHAKARIAVAKVSNDLKNFKLLSKKRVQRAGSANLPPLIDAQDKALTLDKQLQTYEQIRIDLQTEVDSLKRTLDSRDELIRHIQKESSEANQQLIDEGNKITKKLATATNRIDELLKQLETRQEEIDTASQLNQTLKDEGIQLTTQLTETKKTLFDKKEVATRLEVELRNTKKQLSEQTSKLQNREKQLADQTERYKQAEQSFEETTENLKLELSQLKTQLLDTTSHNTSLEATNLSLHSELHDAHHKNTLSSLQQQIEDREKEIADIRDSNDALQSERDQVFARNVELQSDFDNLEKDALKLGKDIDILRQKVSDGTDKNKTLEDSISILNQKLVEANDRNSQLNIHINSLNDLIAQRNEFIKDLNNELDSLKDPSINNTPGRTRNYNFNNTTITSPNDADTSQNTMSRSNSPQNDDIATPLVEKLGELFSREEKKTISIYKGKITDKIVTDWLKSAERVARNNSWSGEQKLRFFSDRLGGEALDWHTTYADEKGAQIDYDEWKQDFIARFRDEADVEKLKNKLQTLRQKPEQRTRAFVSKINELFDTIHGKEPAIPAALAAQTEKNLYQDILKLRNETKKKILLKGLSPKIKQELWPRTNRDNTYAELCEHAYTAESVVINKDLNEDKGLTAVIAGMSHHERQQDKEIEILRTQIETMKINDANAKQELQGQETTIAVADRYQQRRSFSGERRPDNRVQFRNTPLQRSNSYSQIQGTDNRFLRSRDKSTERFPPNRINYQRSRSPRPYNSERPRFEQRAISPRPFITPPTVYNNNPINPSNTAQTSSYNSSSPRFNSSQRRPNSFNRPVQGRPQFSQFQRNSQRLITCFKCGYRGHIAKECRTTRTRPPFPPRRN